MVDAKPPPSLAVHDLSAWYSESHVLHGVGFVVGAGEVVTFLGRNGAGKTTLMKSVMGVLTKRLGSVRISGMETIRLPSDAIARLGLGYVPEERGIYSSLTVEENLYLPPIIQPGGPSIGELFRLFPNLLGRLNARGTSLSGGEQQMLAIARILRAGSRTLLLDEPTEGLAPVIVDQIQALLEYLKLQKYTILLVEQNILLARAVSDRYVVIENGKKVDEMDNVDFDSSKGKLATYIGI